MIEVFVNRLGFVSSNHLFDGTAHTYSTFNEALFTNTKNTKPVKEAPFNSN